LAIFDLGRAKLIDIRWADVLDRWIAIVNRYDGGITLRQLFYRQVSEGVIPNSQDACNELSIRTAEACRAGLFLGTIDHAGAIAQAVRVTSPADALQWIIAVYVLARSAQASCYALIFS
jgi:hypothetical protein